METRHRGFLPGQQVWQLGGHINRCNMVQSEGNIGHALGAGSARRFNRLKGQISRRLRGWHGHLQRRKLRLDR